MSGRGHRGQSRTSAPGAPPERYVEHTLRSKDASMHQPLVEPSRAADPRGGTLTMDHVIDCYSSYPSDTGVSKRAEGHDRMRSKIKG